MGSQAQQTPASPRTSAWRGTAHKRSHRNRNEELSASIPLKADALNIWVYGAIPYRVDFLSRDQKVGDERSFSLKRFSWTSFAGSVRPSVMETKQKCGLWALQLLLLCQLRLLKQKKTEQLKLRTVNTLQPIYKLLFSLSDKVGRYFYPGGCRVRLGL